MARVPNHKYYTAFLLVMSVVCINADGNENTEIDMETFASHNHLVNSLSEDSQNLSRYAFERSEEVCQKLLDEEIFKNETSVASETRELIMSNCVNRVLNRLIPKVIRRYGNHADEMLLSKFGFEDIRKVVDQKYDAFFKEIVQRIDDYVKGLTPEQQKKTMAKNLVRWSRKIKNAPTLEWKQVTFAKCMRFYDYER